MKPIAKRGIAGAALILAALVAGGLWWCSGDELESDGTAGGGRSGGVSGNESRGSGSLFPRGSSMAAAGQDGAVSAEEGRAAVSAGWGSGPGELGRKRPEEGNPEGPMSFAISPEGDYVVLDQVNGRIIRYDRQGKVLGTIPIAQQYPQDVAFAPDGTMLVLDRLVDKSLAVYDRNGNLKTELKIEGPNLTEAGSISGLFVDGNDVYAEVDNAGLVRVGDVDGKADPEQPQLNCRPALDGRLCLTGNIADAEAGKLLVAALDKASMQNLFTVLVPMGSPVIRMGLLDTDRNGTIYTAAQVDLGAAAQGGEADPEVNNWVWRLVCLSPENGAVVGRADIPVSTVPEERLIEFRVLPQGGVVYAAMSEKGIAYRVYHCL